MRTPRHRPFPKILIHGRHIALGFFVIAILVYIGMVLIPSTPQTSYTANTISVVKTSKDTHQVAPKVSPQSTAVLLRK